MNTRARFATFFFCVLILTAAGCAPNAPSTGQTPQNPSSSSGSLQPTVALAPTLAPTETTIPTPAPTPTSNPLSALSGVLSNFGAAKSYRVQITSTGTTSDFANGLKMEVVQPDRVHSVVPGVGEVIQIGSTTFYKQGANGKWTKLSLPPGVTPSALSRIAFDPKTVVSRALSAKGVTFSGPDILDGKPMLTYTYTPDPTLDKTTVSGKMWIGATDGLPYKLQGTETNKSIVTITFTYDSAITINPPIP